MKSSSSRRCGASPTTSGTSGTAQSTDNHPVINTDNIVIWTARAQSGRDSGRDRYVAVFNISDTAQTVRYAWSDLGLSAPGYGLRDLWTHKDIGSATSVEITLPPHASVFYRATPLRKSRFVSPQNNDNILMNSPTKRIAYASGSTEAFSKFMATC